MFITLSYTIEEVVESIMEIMELDPNITTHTISEYFAARGLKVKPKKIKKIMSDIKKKRI
jgi:hypothetical protein